MHFLVNSTGQEGLTCSYCSGTENLGFDIVDTPEEADVIVLESNKFDKSQFSGRKPTIVVGGSAMQRLENSVFQMDFDVEDLKVAIFDTYEGYYRR